MQALSSAHCTDVRGKFNNASALGRSFYWCQALHIMNKDRYQSTSARRALALLNSPLALHITNKDRYQNNERPRALALLNSPLQFDLCAEVYYNCIYHSLDKHTFWA